LDFADILDKWEHGQYGGKPRSSGKPPSSKTPQEAVRASRNTMEEWLSNHEVYDKDANEQETLAPGEQRRRLLRTQPDAILDIHGLTDEKAWLTLDDFFSMARDKGYKKLRIIHGKGNRSKGEAVLSRTVRAFIEQCPYAGESGYEKAANGGTGATWVFLK
jgi:DNA-nicking Smr family endonuclease